MHTINNDITVSFNFKYSTHDVMLCYCIVFQIGKSSKKRLFQAEEQTDTPGSNHSSLQKSRGNTATLEHHHNDSPTKQKPPAKKGGGNPSKTGQLNTEQLKCQLERKILEDHEENLRNKNKHEENPERVESETQKSEAKVQKFGIRVLPIDQHLQQKSPKNAELSQNDNNINIERHSQRASVDEVDKITSAPPVKKRERKIPDTETFEAVDPEPFVRRGSLTSSGIRRDENGIPQEIPNHMLNAAVAARKNRKPSHEDIIADKDDSKACKKVKGKAPLPPESLATGDDSGDPKASGRNDFDDVSLGDSQVSHVQTEDPKLTTLQVRNEIENYNSDSDVETDNQSSVNTIELNASDITIHQTEENEDKQNRKTASTGDLTKMQRNRKISTGTLERAQSLDITDTGMPVLTKKRKGAKEDLESGHSDGEDDFFNHAMISKEPRLSLILDGLNTFERSRLKKSTEWGNLEDAILQLNNSGSGNSVNDSGENSVEILNGNFEVDAQSPELNALVNKINEIKQESSRKSERDDRDPASISDNSVLESHDNIAITTALNDGFSPVKRQLFKSFDYSTTITSKPDDEVITMLETNSKTPIGQQNDNQLGIRNYQSEFTKETNTQSIRLQHEEGAEDNNNKSLDKFETIPEVAPKPNFHHLRQYSQIIPHDVSSSFLIEERHASSRDFYPDVKLDDINIPDDMKVSRHSLGSLERPKFISTENKRNVSNIIVSDQFIDNSEPQSYDSFIQETKDVSELYSTAIDDVLRINPEITPKKSYETITISTPDLIKNVSITEAIRNVNDEVTIEGPTSLTFKIPGDSISTGNVSNGNIRSFGETIDPTEKPSSSLTYITEIQVTTPSSVPVTEIDTMSNRSSKSKNLDTEFEDYVKNFESKVLAFEERSTGYGQHRDAPKGASAVSIVDKMDAEKELHKIKEIAEEQLKKLPEMRFSTSSYERAKTPEKRQSQIELLRSNFEKSPPRAVSSKGEQSSVKSRIPIATTTKTPPTSPERRDSRNLDFEMDKELMEIMSSGIPSSTPYSSSSKSQPKVSTNKNVTVTSIKNSKIPSGVSYGNRPPVPPRKADSDVGNIIQVSSNGNSESSFKQWVFNPSENSVTNITLTDAKNEK